MIDHYKITLWGSYSAGKTCLSWRWVHGNWLKNVTSTIGAAYSSKKLTVLVDGVLKTVNVGMWDSAGSERYEAMVKAYLRRSNLTLLCLDGLDMPCPEKIQRSLDQIKEGAGLNTRIALVITKSDKITDFDNTVYKFARGLAINEPQIIGIYFTSAFTGEGVNELFEDVVRDLIQKYPDYIPNDENTVRLASPRKSFIDKFKILCSIL